MLTIKHTVRCDSIFAVKNIDNIVISLHLQIVIEQANPASEEA